MDTFVLNLIILKDDVKRPKLVRLHQFFSPKEYEKNNKIILKYS